MRTENLAQTAQSVRQRLARLNVVPSTRRRDENGRINRSAAKIVFSVRLMPKYVVSTIEGTVPHFTACRAVVQQIQLYWNKFPNADITEPAALLYASYRPSLKLEGRIGVVRVTNEGVVRVKTQRCRPEKAR